MLGVHDDTTGVRVVLHDRAAYPSCVFARRLVTPIHLLISQGYPICWMNRRSNAPMVEVYDDTTGARVVLQDRAA